MRMIVSGEAILCGFLRGDFETRLVVQNFNLSFDRVVPIGSPNVRPKVLTKIIQLRFIKVVYVQADRKSRGHKFSHSRFLSEETRHVNLLVFIVYNTEKMCTDNTRRASDIAKDQVAGP